MCLGSPSRPPGAPDDARDLSPAGLAPGPPHGLTPRLTPRLTPGAERRIAEIWHDVLGVTAPAPGATFTDLGGTALDALRIAARVETDLGVRIGPGEVYRHGDAGSFARHVVTRAAGPRAHPG